MALLIDAMGKVNKLKEEIARLQGLLTDIEGEATRLKGETAMLQGLLTRAKEKASLVEHRASKVAIEVVDAFQKGKNIRQELLESGQDAFAKGVQWLGRKVAKHYPDIDLDVLSSRRSSSSSKSSSSDIEDGGKVTSPVS